MTLLGKERNLDANDPYREKLPWMRLMQVISRTCASAAETDWPT